MHQFFLAENRELLHFFDDGPNVAHGFHDVPEPASPLVRIIAAPSAIRRSASPRLRAPHTNGTLKSRLSTWCSSSGWRQHLALVDVVDA